MKPLQRYNIDTVFEPTWNNDGWEERLQIKESDNGDWVKWEDVKKLEELNKEMMDVLKLLRSEMSSQCTTDGCTCGDGWRHDDPEVIAKVDAAIAKSKGQQQ